MGLQEGLRLATQAVTERCRERNGLALLPAAQQLLLGRPWYEHPQPKRPGSSWLWANAAGTTANFLAAPPPRKLAGSCLLWRRDKGLAHAGLESL